MNRLCQDYQSDSDGSEDETHCISSSPCNTMAADATAKPTVCILSSFPESAKEKMDLGFQRAAPHMEGNWAGHIYLPLSIIAETDGATQNWEEQWNQTSFQTFLHFASQTVKHFVATKTRTPFDATATSADEEEADIVVIPHFKYPHVDDVDDDGENSEQNSSTEDNSSCSSSDLVVTKPVDTKKRARDSSLTHSKPETFHRCKKQKIPQQSSCNLHVSVAKPFYLQQHNIDSFISDLTQHVQAWQEMQPGPLILSFPIQHSTASYSVLFNDEQTRAFLTLSTIEESSIQLIPWIRTVIDPVMTKYGFPTYRFDGKTRNSENSMIEDPTLVDRGQVQLHVTIASMLGKSISSLGTTTPTRDSTPELQTNIQELNTKEVEEKGSTFIPRHLVCVLGNYHTFIIPFTT